MRHASNLKRNDLLLVGLGFVACIGLWLALEGLPGRSALFPRILLSTMMICLLGVGAQALRKGPPSDAPDLAADTPASPEPAATASDPSPDEAAAQHTRALARQGAISAALIAFVAWFSYIGPFSAVALFTTVLTWVLHPRRNRGTTLLTSLVIGLCLAAFVYLVFGQALQVSFPRGLETPWLKQLGL